MVGVIKTWNILAHPVVTIRCFGWRVFFKAAVSWQGGTFLSLLQEAGCFERCCLEGAHDLGTLYRLGTAGQANLQGA